jgi:hypothetical protein
MLIFSTGRLWKFVSIIRESMCTWSTTARRWSTETVYSEWTLSIDTLLSAFSTRCQSKHMLSTKYVSSFSHLSIYSLLCPDGDPCDMDVSEGVGPFNLTRHYYDRESRRCREFIYHGRKGTINNFLSLDDCERTCPGISGLYTQMISSIKTYSIRESMSEWRTVAGR